MRNHTAPVTYRLEHRVSDIMRQHDAKLKLDPSLPAYPEHLLWHWHPAKGCRLPLATDSPLFQRLASLRPYSLTHRLTDYLTYLIISSDCVDCGPREVGECDDLPSTGVAYMARYVRTC